MDQLMLDQIATQAERLPATGEDTQERFFSRMNAPVPGKINPGTKPAGAAFKGAHTGPVIAVHILMHLQGVAASEGFATAAIKTDKGTVSVMNKLVGVQGAGIFETFATALERADKRPLPRMAIVVNPQDRRADKGLATGFVGAEHTPGSAMDASQMAFQTALTGEAADAGVMGAGMRPCAPPHGSG